MKAAATRFTPLQRILHWLMAVMIVAMLFIGIGMVSTLQPRFLTLISIHKPLGIAILMLALVRLVVRLRRGTPPLPADLPPLQVAGAKASHYLLYALMIVMPLVGWSMLSAGGYPVVLYGPVHLPQIMPHNDALHALLRAAHTWLAYLLFATILLHVAAALFHALVRHDGVFESMASWHRQLSPKTHPATDRPRDPRQGLTERPPLSADSLSVATVSHAIENLKAAQQQALSIRPKVGGFPYLAEVLRRAGVRRNLWFLPACQSLYLTNDGPVVMQGTPLVSGMADVSPFDREALINALRIDQSGDSSFPEFLAASWRAGVVRYDVDLAERTVSYFGCNDEQYVESYPAVDLK